jgi:hypothetical protein
VNKLLLQHASPDGDDDDDIPFHQRYCSVGDEDVSFLDLMTVVAASYRGERIFQIVYDLRNNTWEKHLLLCRHRGDFVRKYHMI